MNLRLDLDYQNFEKQRFFINELLIAERYFLRIYEFGKKFHLIHENTEKKYIKRISQVV